jgi:hypothetical protein
MKVALEEIKLKFIGISSNAPTKNYQTPTKVHHRSTSKTQKTRSYSIDPDEGRHSPEASIRL